MVNLVEELLELITEAKTVYDARKRKAKKDGKEYLKAKYHSELTKFFRGIKKRLEKNVILPSDYFVEPVSIIYDHVANKMR